MAEILFHRGTILPGDWQKRKPPSPKVDRKTIIVTRPPAPKTK